MLQTASDENWLTRKNTIKFDEHPSDFDGISSIEEMMQKKSLQYFFRLLEQLISGWQIVLDVDFDINIARPDQFEVLFR